MEQLKCLIHSDEFGSYSAKEVLKQIQNKNLGIEFPNKPIDETCLQDLMYKGKQCCDSISIGKIWNEKLCTYTEREILLRFA
jgi:copper oxidase (laccase) domain-containing protein